MKGVYLLHFARPFGHARHYLGYADDIDRRVKEHRRGKAARLTQVVRKAGIPLMLAATWPGANRRFERTLKNRKNAGKFCPICRLNALVPSAQVDVDFYGGAA